MLNNEQLKLLAQFTSNLGLVFSAAVITPLFSGDKNVNIVDITSALSLALIYLAVSLFLIKGVKK